MTFANYLSTIKYTANALAMFFFAGFGAVVSYSAIFLVVFLLAVTELKAVQPLERGHIVLLALSMFFGHELILLLAVANGLTVTEFIHQTLS